MKEKNKAKNLVEMFNQSTRKYAECRCQWWRTDTGSTASLDYDQVGLIVREMAAGFFELKVEKQDRIAIMSENCPQWLWADFSILSAAAVSVPIYPSFSQRETAYIINDSGAKILFVQNDQAMQRIMDVWDAMPCLERIIVMQDNSSIQHPYVLNLRDLREMGRGLLEKQPDALEKRLASIEMEDAMTIIYTSGTTGNQKGIIHTHRSFNAANEIDFKIIPHISSEDVLLSILPLSHSYERQFGQMMSICVGCTIAYADKSDSLIDSLQCFSPSWFVAAPSIFEKIFTAIWKEFDHSSHDRLMLANALTIGLEVVEANADEHGFIDASEQRDFLQGILPKLRDKYLCADQQVYARVREMLGGNYRFGISAAGALPAHLCRAFIAMRLPIMEGYGLVETCNTVNLNPIHKILPGSVGPLAGSVSGCIAEDGEWLVRGDNLMLAYWKNEEANQEAFTEDGYLKTGDIVEELADGYIKIVDRKKALLVLRNGAKVPTVKIENLFALSPVVDQVFVIGDDREHVVGLVVPRFDFFIKYYQKHEIVFNETLLQFVTERDHSMCVKVGLDFIGKSPVKEMIDKEINEANQKLEDYEKIRNYLIINRRFNQMASEITPTLKFKRTNIYKHFAVEIENLYKEIGDQ